MYVIYGIIALGLIFAPTPTMTIVCMIGGSILINKIVSGGK